MKRFLIRYGLIVEKEIILNISRDEFLDVLRDNVDSYDTKDFFFKKTSNTYKGVITNHSFKIKENHRVFDSSFNDATLYGQIDDYDNSKTILQVESNGMSNNTWMFFIGGLLFLFTIPLFFNSGAEMIGAITTLLMSLGFMILPIQMARSSVKKMIHNFEREIFYLVEKKRSLTSPSSNYAQS